MPEAALLRALGAGAPAARPRSCSRRPIDALDITILRGGGDEVGLWAKNHGFRLPPDAPEVLDFYAERARSSWPPPSMPTRPPSAARRSATGRRSTSPSRPTTRGSRCGSWPSASRRPRPVEADVYLLTDERPALLPNAGAFGESTGLILDHSDAASDGLLADLRSDAGMGWVPDDAWLTKVVVDAPAGELDFDLAIDATGAGQPVAGRRGLRAVPADAGTAVADCRATSWPPRRARRGRAGRPRAARRERLAAAAAGRRMSALPRLAVARRCSSRRRRSPAAPPAARRRSTITIHYSPFDPTEVTRPARRADHVRPRQRGPDRPRVADRRRGVPRARIGPARTPATATAERGHDSRRSRR